MSTHEDEPHGGISDEDLPEDLQPREDNPLAQPLDDDAPAPEDLDVLGGKTPEGGPGDAGSDSGD